MDAGGVCIAYIVYGFFYFYLYLAITHMLNIPCSFLIGDYAAEYPKVNSIRTVGNVNR